MLLDREQLDRELAHVQSLLVKTEQEVIFIKGGLNVLRQLRALLDKEAVPAEVESTPCSLPAV